MLPIYRNKIYEIIPLLLILVFSLVGMNALFHEGLFTAHDIYHQVTRLYYYYNSVADGQFPPYWIMQLASNHGYPLFFFSYHLPWLMGLPMLMFGTSIYTTLKALFFIGFFLSGLSMYFFSKAILLNKKAAILSSILYLWAPYHFLAIFVGASIGVVFSFIFLPLILLGLHLCFKNNKQGVIVLAVSLAGIILSHITHLILFIPTIILFLIWELVELRVRKQNLKGVFIKLLLAIILSILISAFYLIPAFYYRSLTYIKTESGFATLYERHFINFSQLIYSKWGFGPIVNNAKNGEISFQLGIAQWISILGLVLLKLFKKIKDSLFFFLLSAFLLNTFLLLDYSSFIWKVISRYLIIDYPFRLILPLVFISSFSAGLIFIKIDKRLQNLFFVLILLTAFYTNRNHTKVNLYTNLKIEDYLTSVITTTTNTFHEYTPLTAHRSLVNKKETSIATADVPVASIRENTNTLEFSVNLDKDQNISINQFYFPGLNTYIDNQKIPVTADENGLIKVDVPKGTHSITVLFEDTLLIKIAKSLTLIGIALVLIFWQNSLLRRKKTTTGKPQSM